MPKVNERHQIVRDLLEIMSKEELAGKMKVSSFTVTRWEKARHTPSFAAFYYLKKLYKKDDKR